MTKIRGFEIISQKQFEYDTECYMEATKYEEIKRPRRATKRSSGNDFYSLLDFVLKPGEDILLPTGIKTYMLDDEELLLFPRSSIGFNYKIKIDNTIGKIDSDYYGNPKNEGHIWIKLTNTGNKVWEVKKGDAIVQGTFYKYLVADNDDPLSEERVGGIGSTNN